MTAHEDRIAAVRYWVVEAMDAHEDGYVATTAWALQNALNVLEARSD